MSTKGNIILDKSQIAQSQAHTWEDDQRIRPAVAKLIKKDDPILSAIDRIPPEYLIQSEIGLEEMIREKNRDGKFDRTLGLVKIMFWDEYKRSISTKTPMKMEHVWKQLVTETWWKNNVLGKPLNLAWMVTPFADEIVVQKEMIQVGFKKLREVLELPIVDKMKGFEMHEGRRIPVIIEKVNLGLVKEQRAILSMIIERVHGAVTQKHQIVSKNLNVNVPGKSENIIASSSDIPQLGLDSHSLTLEQLEAYEQKLIGIESKLGKVEIDVESRALKKSSKDDGE